MLDSNLLFIFGLLILGVIRALFSVTSIIFLAKAALEWLGFVADFASAEFNLKLLLTDVNRTGTAGSCEFLPTASIEAASGLDFYSM